MWDECPNLPCPKCLSPTHHRQPGQPTTPHSDGYTHCNILYYCAMYMCMYCMSMPLLATTHTVSCTVTLYRQGAGRVCRGVIPRVHKDIFAAHKIATSRVCDRSGSSLKIPNRRMASCALVLRDSVLRQTHRDNTIACPSKWHTFSPILCVSSTSPNVSCDVRVPQTPPSLSMSKLKGLVESPELCVASEESE